MSENQGIEVSDKEPEIAKQFQRLNVNIANLSDIIVGLEDRLTPVMNERTPNVKEDEKQPQYQASPLAMELNSICMKVCDLHERINQIRSRVEL
jgi:hypothetical protein